MNEILKINDSSNKSTSHFHEIESKIISSLNKFHKNEYELFDLMVDERAICHQIACYLKNKFGEYDVDCEYNRMHHDVKKIAIQEQYAIIRPDIIIHKRNKRDNLLVIEVKKSGRPVLKDIKKLESLTALNGFFQYKFGLLICYSYRKKGDYILSWFIDGRKRCTRKISVSSIDMVLN